MKDRFDGVIISEKVATLEVFYYPDNPIEYIDFTFTMYRIYPKRVTKGFWGICHDLITGINDEGLSPAYTIKSL